MTFVGATDAIRRAREITQMIDTVQTGSTSSGATFGATLSAAQAAQGVGVAQQTAPPGAVPAGGVSGVPYASEINAAAARNGVPPALLAGLVKQESGFDPRVVSSAGAVGLTQLMPGTARSLGVTDSTDPVQALDGGARYLRQMLDRFNGDQRLALAAYNAGPGAVQKFGGIPPYAETRAYVDKVLANAAQIGATAAPQLGSALPAPAATPQVGSPIGLSSTPTVPGSGSGLGYPIT